LGAKKSRLVKKKRKSFLVISQKEKGGPRIAGEEMKRQGLEPEGMEAKAKRKNNTCQARGLIAGEKTTSPWEKVKKFGAKRNWKNGRKKTSASEEGDRKKLPERSRARKKEKAEIRKEGRALK